MTDQTYSSSARTYNSYLVRYTVWLRHKSFDPWESGDDSELVVYSHIIVSQAHNIVSHCPPLLGAKKLTVPLHRDEQCIQGKEQHSSLKTLIIGPAVRGITQFCQSPFCFSQEQPHVLAIVRPLTMRPVTCISIEVVSVGTSPLTHKNKVILNDWHLHQVTTYQETWNPTKIMRKQPEEQEDPPSARNSICWPA